MAFCSYERPGEVWVVRRGVQHFKPLHLLEGLLLLS